MPKLTAAAKAEVAAIRQRGPICASYTWVPCRVCLTPCPKELGEKHLTCVDPQPTRVNRKKAAENQPGLF